MFWRGLFVLLLGYVVGGYGRRRPTVPRFDMAGVNETFFDPNSFPDAYSLRCPMAHWDYVVCPAKQTGRVCVCSHAVNMTFYDDHLCLQRPTWRENVEMAKNRIIYLRIKFRNDIAVDKELLPELAKPMIELDVTDPERSVVHLQCMPDPNMLVVAYLVSLHDMNHKLDVVDWKNIFIKTLNEGGKLEAIDVEVIRNFYDFQDVMEIMTHRVPMKHETTNHFISVVCILLVIGTLSLVAYHFKSIYKIVRPLIH